MRARSARRPAWGLRTCRVTDPEPPRTNHPGAGNLGRPGAPAPPPPRPRSSGLRDWLRGPGAGRTASRRDGVRRPGRSLLLSVTGGRGFGSELLRLRRPGVPPAPLPTSFGELGVGAWRAAGRDADGRWASGPPSTGSRTPGCLEPACLRALTLPSPNPVPPASSSGPSPRPALPLRPVPSVLSRRDLTPALPPPPHHRSCVNAVSPLAPL